MRRTRGKLGGGSSSSTPSSKTPIFLSDGEGESKGDVGSEEGEDLQLVKDRLLSQLEELDGEGDGEGISDASEDVGNLRARGKTAVSPRKTNAAEAGGPKSRDDDVGGVTAAIQERLLVCYRQGMAYLGKSETDSPQGDVSDDRRGSFTGGALKDSDVRRSQERDLRGASMDRLSRGGKSTFETMDSSKVSPPRRSGGEKDGYSSSYMSLPPRGGGGVGGGSVDGAKMSRASIDLSSSDEDRRVSRRNAAGQLIPRVVSMIDKSSSLNTRQQLPPVPLVKQGRSYRAKFSDDSSDGLSDRDVRGRGYATATLSSAGVVTDRRSSKDMNPPTSFSPAAPVHGVTKRRPAARDSMGPPVKSVPGAELLSSSESSPGSSSSSGEEVEESALELDRVSRRTSRGGGVGGWGEGTSQGGSGGGGGGAHQPCIIPDSPVVSSRGGSGLACGPQVSTAPFLILI